MLLELQRVQEQITNAVEYVADASQGSIALPGFLLVHSVIGPPPSARRLRFGEERREVKQLQKVRAVFIRSSPFSSGKPLRHGWLDTHGVAPALHALHELDGCSIAVSLEKAQRDADDDDQSESAE